jgi:hypothetical protein
MVAALAAGCQPKPKFKVAVTDIPAGTQTLLARVWLVQNTDQNSQGIFAAGGLDPASIKLSVPTYLTQEIPVPACAISDSSCVQSSRQYSFAVDFPDTLLDDYQQALLGIAAVQPESGSSGLNRLNAVASAQHTLLGKNDLSIDSLNVSLLKGMTGSGSCVDLSPRKSDTDNVTPTIAAINVGYSEPAGGVPDQLLTISGWDFQTDLTVAVGVGNTAPTQLKYGATTAGTATADDPKVLYVTPAEIGLRLGSLLRVSDPNRQDVYITVAVGSAAPTAQFFLNPTTTTPKTCAM